MKTITAMGRKQRPETVRMGRVPFGSTFRDPTDARLFVLTWDYFSGKSGDPDRTLLAVCIANGHKKGMALDTQVEIIYKKDEIMKILNGKCEAVEKVPVLSDIKDGETIRFRNNLGSIHKVEDVFIVTNVQGSYWPTDAYNKPKYTDRKSVVNLRTGRLAMGSLTRMVVKVEASVCLEE